MQSGVYEICNTQNNKTYIGSATLLNSRFSNHRYHLRKGDHGNPHLQRAWNKYGEGAFEFRVLLNCPKSDLITLEQTMMDANHPEYNIHPIAGSRSGHKHSEETRRKMSLARMGNKYALGSKLSVEHREKLRKACMGAIPWNKGKKLDLQSETRRKMSDAQKRRWKTEKAWNEGKNLSEEHRRKISESLKKYWANRRADAIRYH